MAAGGGRRAGERRRANGVLSFRAKRGIAVALIEGHGGRRKSPTLPVLVHEHVHVRRQHEIIGDTGDALWYLELIRSRQPTARIRADMMFGRSLAEAA